MSKIQKLLFYLYGIAIFDTLVVAPISRNSFVKATACIFGLTIMTTIVILEIWNYFRSKK